MRLGPSRAFQHKSENLDGNHSKVSVEDRCE